MAQQFQNRELNLKLIDAVSASLRGVRAVHLGDTNHTNNARLFKWLAEPGTMKSFAKSGVKIVCLEVARQEQFLADAVARKIDVFANRGELKRCFAMYAEGLLEADGAYIFSQNRFKPTLSLPESVVKRLG
jgi:hypothetical protein